MVEQATYKEKKKLKVLGINLWELLSYFIIYSIAGYFIETFFALIRYGVLESRQSFLYGPFCSIYGLGAVIMVVFLQYFNKNWATLFAGGFIIGSITEYLASLIGELFLHVKWWDYSNMPFNINGRICFSYSMFWGILAILLMKVVHPHIRKFMAYLLKKTSTQFIKQLILLITIFLIIDCAITAYAINLFTIRIVAENNLDVKNKNFMIYLNNQLSKNTSSKKVRDFLFNDTIMLKTYPNLKVQEVDGTIVYFKDLLPDIKPYYLKFGDKDSYK